MSFFKLFFLLLFTSTSSLLKAEETIKIGVSTFLSGGAASSFGIPLKQSLEFMFKAINNGDVPPPYDTPGIGGKKVSYFFIDESGGATKQVSEFRNPSRYSICLSVSSLDPSDFSIARDKVSFPDTIVG